MEDIKEYPVVVLEDAPCRKAAYSRRPSANSVSLVVSFRDGAAFEEEEEWGISHFLEHVNLLGTPEYSGLTLLSGAIEDLGGQFSAFSTRDSTTYWVRVPSRGFTPALTVLAQVLANTEFSPAAFEAEKGTILQEMERERSNYRLCNNLSLENAMLPYPLGRDALGNADRINAYTLEELKSYKLKNYGARNCYLSIAGEFDEKKLKKELAAAFTLLPAGQERKARALSPRMDGEKYLTREYGGLGQVNLTVGWALDDDPWRHWVQLSLLNTVLGAGFGSLFYRVLREEEHLTYLVTTQLQLYVNGGSFRVSLDVKPCDAGKALALLHGVIGSVASLDDMVMERARNRFCGNLLIRMEDTMEYTRFLNRRIMTGSEPLMVKNIMKLAGEVTVSDLGGLCREALGEESARIGLAGSSEGLRNALKSIKGGND